MTTFESLGLHPVLCRTLAKLELVTPTPIQAGAIPKLLEGRDLMGLAQTGTGKTAAFSLPVIQQLMAIGMPPKARSARALILAPTRELASQIGVNLRNYVRETHLKVQVVVGGASIGLQAKKMERGTDILVATPGRLIDLVERKAVSLAEVRYLVLDEADQMLDLGFIHALKRIAKMVPPERQTLLFSATMPASIEQLAATFLRNPVRVEVTPPGRTADRVTQHVHHVGQREKLQRLVSLLSAEPAALSLVFARTKHGAERLMTQLVAAGFKAASIHGNKSQGQRERAIAAFRSGETRVLVATDVAARGIDIPGVTHVYNFDLPEVPDIYVHRIGRTARAGAEGAAVSLCSASEVHLLAAIEKLTGNAIPVASGTAPSARDARAAEAEERQRKAEAQKARGPRRDNASAGKPRGGKPRGAAPRDPEAGATSDSRLAQRKPFAGPRNEGPAGGAKRPGKPRKAFRGRKPRSRAAA